MAPSEHIARWREHPTDFVREVFGVEPDPWQIDVLDAFPSNPRQAMKACKGPGKTAVEAWLAWNFLLTRPRPKIAATSISEDNLADNLWTEMDKWRAKSPLLTQAFEWTKTRIFSKDHPEEWWMSARTWPKSADKDAQANTLAGLHADYIMFILDEAGSIPTSVLVSAEAALSSCIEGHILLAGNPTSLEGTLYYAAKLHRDSWWVKEITGDPDDPKRSTRVKKEWAEQQIKDHGRDNPWVLVNVFGQFPPQSLMSLIGEDDVRAAFIRRYREGDVSASARVLGVDVARYGDDSSVIFPRQGQQAFLPYQHRNINGTEGAGHVLRVWNEWDADAAFIDNTGGFGSSWIDNLNRLGKSPTGIHFSQASSDPKYFNKRSEMAFLATEWVKNGGALPEDNELLEEMTKTEYTFQKDKLLVQPKDDIKAKLGRSPDKFDSFMLTFAFPVVRVPRSPIPQKGPIHTSDYNPLSRERVRVESGSGTHDSNYVYDPRR